MTYKASGKLSVETDREVYIAGDLVTVKISVEIWERTRAKTIELRLFGYEQSRWRDDVGNPYWRAVEREFGASQEILRQRVRLELDEMVIDPGECMLPPLVFRIPPDAPGSLGSRFDHGKIRYKVVAFIHVPGLLRPNLVASRKIRVVESPIHHVDSFAWNVVSRGVRLFGCIRRGDLGLEVSSSRSWFVLGETAVLSVVVDNHTRRDVRNLKVEMFRVVLLRDQFGRGHIDMHRVGKKSYEGVRAGETRVSRVLSFMIPSDIQPSVAGDLVCCYYQFRIRCDVSWAPDVAACIDIGVYDPYAASRQSSGSEAEGALVDSESTQSATAVIEQPTGELVTIHRSSPSPTSPPPAALLTPSASPSSLSSSAAAAPSVPSPVDLNSRTTVQTPRELDASMPLYVLPYGDHPVIPAALQSEAASDGVWAVAPVESARAASAFPASISRLSLESAAAPPGVELPQSVSLVAWLFSRALDRQGRARRAASI